MTAECFVSDASDVIARWCTIKVTDAVPPPSTTLPAFNQIVDEISLFRLNFITLVTLIYAWIQSDPIGVC